MPKYICPKCGKVISYGRFQKLPIICSCSEKIEDLPDMKEPDDEFVNQFKSAVPGEKDGEIKNIGESTDEPRRKKFKRSGWEGTKDIDSGEMPDDEL